MPILLIRNTFHSLDENEGRSDTVIGAVVNKNPGTFVIALQIYALDSFQNVSLSSPPSSIVPPYLSFWEGLRI